MNWQLITIPALVAGYIGLRCVVPAIARWHFRRKYGKPARRVTRVYTKTTAEIVDTLWRQK